jgi:hypothetical protein
MRTRPITVFAVALALLAAVAPAARAQDKWPADVQRVYDDYRTDGRIDVCDHTQKTLEDTRDTIKADYDRDYPDFREAVEAGIDKHKDGGCGGDSSSDSSGGGTPPAATSTPDTGASSGALPEATATPDTGTTPDTGAESGTLPDASPTPAATVPPEDAIPPQTGTPVPTVPPAAPAATPTPAIVHTGHRSLTLPIVLIVIALLGLLALALSAVFARRNPRLQHAWREAAFRTRGTWADFSDWLRLGR